VAEIAERLIAYWSGELEMDEKTRRSCCELTARLVRSIPPVELATVRRAPHGHRKSVERWIEGLLEGGAHRNLSATPREVGSQAPRPTPPPVPAADPLPVRSVPAAGGSAVQDISGSGNVSFNVSGSVAGPVNMQLSAPQPTSPTAPVSPDTAVAPGSFAATLFEREGPIRILFLGANPTDGVRLRLDQEVRAIDQALRLADLGSRFELWQKWAVRPSDLQAHLLRHRPDILHFSGHGGPGSAILLEGEDGTTRPVDADRLARLLAQFNRRLRCVFLNACYSEAQASAIAREVDCVIGMSDEVLDRAAILFAANFYQALAFGCSVKAAFDLCRADIEVGEMRQDAVLQLVAVRRDPDAVVFVRNS
jgi:hypothetical protein